MCISSQGKRFRLLLGLLCSFLVIILIVGLVIFFREDVDDSKMAFDSFQMPNVNGTFRMPDETAPHEGTWLQWPHHFTYGRQYRDRIESTWIAMTRALVESENVHIIVYNQNEEGRVRGILNSEGIDETNVSFHIMRNDDTWIRDNGPIFARDEKNELVILDWGFNGWGNDAPYKQDNLIPSKVAKDVNMTAIDLNNVVLEGGAIEIDGRGSALATRSSVLLNGRNPNVNETTMEAILQQFLGVHNMIWLDGQSGGREDITDTHIDGVARFGDPRTIVTMERDDLIYYGLLRSDVDKLYRATDTNGEAYRFVYLPLTKKDVVTTYGKNLRFKGSYVNYYTANEVVLVPGYSDENDAKAVAILEQLYAPQNRKVVQIDVRNLYRNGGMIHCVTQQQPA